MNAINLNPTPPSTIMNGRRVPTVTDAVDASTSQEMIESRAAVDGNPLIVSANIDSDEDAVSHNSTILTTSETQDASRIVAHVDEKKEEEGANSDEMGLEDLPCGNGESNHDNMTSSTQTMDYANLDETPYEHGFEPGDHVIRWDILPILWPIQIHGIVLEVSEDRTEVTICDFGVTTVKNNGGVDSGSGSSSRKVGGSTAKDMERLVAEENAILKGAINDDVEKNGETSESTSLIPSTGTGIASETKKKENSTELRKESTKKKQRLNVIKLTKWSDLRKWHRVNYNGTLLNSGVGKGLKSLGEKTEKLWTSMTKSFVKTESTSQDDKKVRQEGGIDMAEVKSWNDSCVSQNKAATCDPEYETVSDKKDKEAVKAIPSSPSRHSSQSSVSGDKIQSPSKLHSRRRDSEANDFESNSAPCTVSTTDESKSDVELDEPKTLAQMIAEANEIEKRCRQTVVKTVSSYSDKSIMGEKQRSWHGSLMKSLSNMFPQNDEKESSTKPNSTRGGETTKRVSEKQPKTPENLPKSDPTVLVLARTRFLLEQGEAVLPPYHIINSNSECIAVWCKTGRWSTLQAAVFLHSTAIGNVKSTTALTLGVAATQPWLLPAVAGVGIAAVGTPWLMLKLANEKWNEATMNLTEKFWMQAEPEVFVECIEKWGRLK